MGMIPPEFNQQTQGTALGMGQQLPPAEILQQLVQGGSTQIGGPAGFMQPLPGALMPPPEPGPDELSVQVQVGILNSIQDLLEKGLDGRGGQLDLTVFTENIAKLTTAYKTLKDADNQQTHLPPELQLEMEQARLDSQLQTEQARLQIEQQRAQMEFQIKQAEADVKLETLRQQAQLKIEQAQIDAQLKTQQAEQDAQIKQQQADQQASIQQQQADLNLATQEDQHLQKMSLTEQQAEQKAAQAKDKKG